MGSKDNKIKKLMSEGHGPIPPELKWEQMEEGILQKMDELQSTQASSARRGAVIRMGMGVVILLFLLLGLFLCTRTKNGEKAAVLRDQAATEQSEFPERPPKEKARFLPSSSLGDPDRKPSTTGHDPEEGTTTAPTSDWSQHSSRSQGTASPQNGKSHLNRTHTQKKEQTVFSAQKPVETLLAADSSITEIDHSVRSEQWAASIKESDAQALANDPVGSAASVDQKEPVLGTPVVLLPTKEFVVAKVPDTLNLPASLQVFPLYEIDPKPEAAVPFSRVSVLSGLSGWAMGYGATKPERHTYERAIPSYHLQLNYLHTSRKNFTLMVGLQYQQLETRFDWSGTLDDYTITLIDTIQQVQTNVLTGQHSEVRGDVEVNVSAIRTIRHYNKIRIYQIPVALGKTWTFNNWQADVLFGGSLNILSKNKGRTLYLGEIQDYDAAATDFSENQWKIHGLLMGRLSYRISDRFGITTGIQFQKSLSNWSTESNIQMYPNILSWEFGVNYQFN